MERFCVFDIETASLNDAAVYIPAPKPRANLKDPVKIEADIREKTASLLDRAALDPDLCRIVAAGWDCDGTAESAVCADVDAALDWSPSQPSLCPSVLFTSGPRATLRSPASNRAMHPALRSAKCAESRQAPDTSCPGCPPDPEGPSHSGEARCCLPWR